MQGTKIKYCSKPNIAENEGSSIFEDELHWGILEIKLCTGITRDKTLHGDLSTILRML